MFKAQDVYKDSLVRLRVDGTLLLYVVVLGLSGLSKRSFTRPYPNKNLNPLSPKL